MPCAGRRGWCSSGLLGSSGFFWLLVFFWRSFSGVLLVSTSGVLLVFDNRYDLGSAPHAFYNYPSPEAFFRVGTDAMGSWVREGGSNGTQISR